MRGALNGRKAIRWSRGGKGERGDNCARPKVAFVLPCGGSTGAAQVGIMRSLLEAGVRPDVIVGCSVGALNGFYLSHDPTAEQVGRLAAIWTSMSRELVFGAASYRSLLRLLRRADHVYEPAPLFRLIADLCALDDLAEGVIPTHVVTTDLDEGQARWWSAGPAHRILAASACLPGLFPPVVLDGHRHVDGGVVDPVPVRRAIELGAREIFVLGEHQGIRPEARERMTAFDVLIRSFAISRYAQLPAAASLAGPDQRVVVVPGARIGSLGMHDFSQSRRLIDESYEVSRQFLAVAA